MVKLELVSLTGALAPPQSGAWPPHSMPRRVATLVVVHRPCTACMPVECSHRNASSGHRSSPNSLT